ncbi:adenylate kinase 8-like [Elysia marginata]|uniref:Adenylate kinase 8-like n=1 Tax=Elysia marginata TaxID=1093978 RepID=A0AAV4H5H0_9GAST|nr:adenylate kinase 8-like [Elysia marginata]
MDQTKRPLKIPPEFATYAEKHGIFDMYKRLIEQLVIARPEDPIAYLIQQLKKENDDELWIKVLKERLHMYDAVKKGWVLEGFPQTRDQALAMQEHGIYPKHCTFSFLCSQPRSNAPHTPRVILLGATGSGKNVQAALLANKYNLVQVACGQLIKQAIAQETKSGMAAKPYVDKEMMMPDSIVLDILKDRLCQLDCVTRGWVLHGYPRTREQAEQLDKAGLRPNRVFFLDVPNDSVIERLTLQAMDPITGEKYHMLYNPPRSQEVKDRLWRNPKNSEENVRKHLSQYFAYVEELSDFYVDGQHINADQDPHTVFEGLESMICKPLPKNFTS